jgi:hypothetical protein
MIPAFRPVRNPRQVLFVQCMHQFYARTRAG